MGQSARFLVRSNSATPRPASAANGLNVARTFEQLEDRLVLTLALHPGPLTDEVVVSPAATAGEFDVLLGPAIVSDATGGSSSSPIIDFSTSAIADRRYAIPASSSQLLFRVDTSQRYRLTAAGHPQVGELQQGLFGYKSFDVDQLVIEPIHVEKFAAATDTTLAAALNPGDMFLLIDDASGWSNAPTESAQTRSLAWYGYADSTGHTYPDFSYTRNVAFDYDDGLWAPGTIWFDASAGAYRVPLNAPWAGPTIAAGTAVRNATSGPELSEPFPESLVNSPVRWPQIAVTIEGEWVDGQRDEFAFRPGTAFIQPFSSVNETIWNEIAFGLERDFPGPMSTITSPSSTGQIVLDLDVLAKQVRVLPATSTRMARSTLPTTPFGATAWARRGSCPSAERTATATARSTRSTTRFGGRILAPPCRCRSTLRPRPTAQ